MSENPENPSIPRSHEAWARFRFSVVGPLLAAPPQRGALQARLAELAAQEWRHPITGQGVQFGYSTLECWYYMALAAPADPVAALRRQIRSDSGQHPALSSPLREALAAQYHQHPNWSYQLHADNLRVLAAQNPALGPAPGYASVRRYMKAHGLCKRPRRGPAHRPGAQAAGGVRQMARTLPSYRSGILTWWKHRISNSRMEGINNKINTLLRQTHAQRGERHLILRLFNLHSSRQELPG